MSASAGGPLTGVRVLELAGIGPGPFCAMMLADSGATVLRIDRPGPAAASGPADRAPARPEREFLNRGRQSAVLDLKHPRAVDALLRLVDTADVLLEGFRPGVTERMGVGPQACLARNPRLVYARMTGWGQEGPLAATAGHDIGYIARTGALHALGRAGGRPEFPANLLGDFGGGGMVMAYGICAALVERATSGQGQVVDTAIVDGVASLLAMPLMLMAQGLWRDERGVNLLDGGVPWYDVYETADGQWMAVGALEPRFYAALLAGLGLTDPPDRVRPPQLARPPRAPDRPLRRAHPGRVDRYLRRHRRVRRTRPVAHRGRRRRTPDRAPDLRHRRRLHPARPRPPFLPHPRPAVRPGPRPRPAHPRGSHRLGPARRRRPGRLRRRPPVLTPPPRRSHKPHFAWWIPLPWRILATPATWIHHEGAIHRDKRGVTPVR